jgi:hypothetical protein
MHPRTGFAFVLVVGVLTGLMALYGEPVVAKETCVGLCASGGCKYRNEGNTCTCPPGSRKTPGDPSGHQASGHDGPNSYLFTCFGMTTNDLQQGRPRSREACTAKGDLRPDNVAGVKYNCVWVASNCDFKVRVDITMTSVGGTSGKTSTECYGAGDHKTPLCYQIGQGSIDIKAAVPCSASAR